MSQSLTSILATTFYGLSVVLEEASIKLRRLSEENEPPSRWVGDDRSEHTSDAECSDEEAERIVEASMAPIDTMIDSEPVEAMAVAFDRVAIRSACLLAATVDGGTSVFDLEKSGLDKAAVKKTLRELVSEGRLTTTGIKRGVRYHLVKAEAAE